MLFKTTEELKERISGLDVNFEFDSIKSDIKWAERKYIKPVLGDEYEAFETDYQDNILAGMVQKYQNLLPYVQDALANFAYAKYMIIGQVNVSDSGIHINTSETKKTAFQWQIEDLKNNYFLRSAFEQLDWLLEFLEGAKATYTDWAGSDAYTINKKFFINSIDQFEAYYDLKNSRQTLRSLYPVMRNVEQFNIREHIGGALFSTLKAGILNNNLSEDNETLVSEYIRPAVAFLSIEMLAKNPGMVTDKGVIIQEIIESSGMSKPAGKLQRQQTKELAETMGQAWLKKLTTYLNENASESVFADYFNSSLYVSPTSETDLTVMNNSDDTKKIFRAF